MQVEYISFNDNYTYKTKIYNEDGKENSFNIDEKFQHNIGFLTEEDINFFLKDKICFKIYAIENTVKKGKKGIPNKEEILRSHVHSEEKIKKNEENKNNLIKKYVDKGLIKKEGKNKKDCLIF